MTEEEQQELQALRQEKQIRQQQSRAVDALEKGGLPAAFAPLLAGTDDEDTDRRTTQFAAAYQAALGDDIRARLPQQGPTLTSAPAPRPRRGIQRIR